MRANVLWCWLGFHLASVAGVVFVLVAKKGGGESPVGVVHTRWNAETHVVTERAHLLVPSTVPLLVGLGLLHLISFLLSFYAMTLDNAPKSEGAEKRAARDDKPDSSGEARNFWFDVRSNQQRPRWDGFVLPVPQFMPFTTRTTLAPRETGPPFDVANRQRISDIVFVSWSGYFLCFLAGGLDVTTGLYQTFAFGVLSWAYFEHWDRRCAQCPAAPESSRFPLAVTAFVVPLVCTTVTASFAFAEGNCPPRPLWHFNAAALASCYAALFGALASLRFGGAGRRGPEHQKCAHHIAMFFFKAPVTAATLALVWQLE